MDEPTRVPLGEQDYSSELLALAIVEAEIRGDFTDQDDLIQTALAEDPRRVIEVLANLLYVELVDGYGSHALCTTDAIRWAWIEPRGSA